MHSAAYRNHLLLVASRVKRYGCDVFKLYIHLRYTLGCTGTHTDPSPSGVSSVLPSIVNSLQGEQPAKPLHPTSELIRSIRGTG